MSGLRKLAAVGDDDGLGGSAGGGSNVLDGLHHIHALDDLSEHHMLPVQPLRLGRTNEELRSVGAGAGVGHGQNSRTSVLPYEILIFEFRSVDRFSTGSVAGREIPTLAHESRDHAVETGALVVQRLPAPPNPLLTGAQRPEVLRRARRRVREQFHHDPAGRLSADRNVKENPRVRHRCKEKEEPTS